MKCQKCAKQAIVHLTEIITGTGAVDGGATGAEEKRAVEIHLCLDHAIQAGLIVPGPEVPPQVFSVQGPGASKPVSTPGSSPDAAPPGDEAPMAIVPASMEPAELIVTRPARPGELCPHCGMSWHHFKQGGLMGCSHDYETFGGKLQSLVKRAQEGATHHIGKVPPRKKAGESERQVVSLRLRHELQKAVEAENYEAAAQLRDQLREIEHR